MQRKSQSFSIRQAAVKTSVFALSMVACATSMAAENGLQRYSPGVGGSDMTSPVVPGWYWQTAAIYYKADKSKGNDGKASALPNGMAVSADASTFALLNRLTYVGTERFLGANVGFTVMQPIGQRKGEFDVPTLAANSPNSQTRLRLKDDSGKISGLGDLEFGPLFHWEIGDNQSANFVPTVVLPTGDYSALDTTPGPGLPNHAQRLNMGYGNFYTFRPSAQYAYIGDGWDVGARGVLSFNTRNKDNGYYSGNMFNVDWQAMKFVTEDVRVGLQGYLVRQLNRDTCKGGIGQALAQCYNPQLLQQVNGATQLAVATGNRTSVNAVGPAVAWLKNGGEFLLEGKFIKEFNAKNRLEGDAFWLTLSKPL